MLAAAWLTAGATTGLLVGAILTAIFAIKAFSAQYREVTAIERQVTDQQQITGQQGQLLEVQSGQLDLQRQQLDEQRGINEAQTGVVRWHVPSCLLAPCEQRWRPGRAPKARSRSRTPARPRKHSTPRPACSP
jgi:hypothetical protein